MLVATGIYRVSIEIVFHLVYYCRLLSTIDRTSVRTICQNPMREKRKLDVVITTAHADIIAMASL